MKTIRFNPEIYPLRVVLAAAEAYKGLAEIAVSDNSSGITVTLQNCRYEENRTAHEFDNYIISLMNQTNGHA